MPNNIQAIHIHIHVHVQVRIRIRQKRDPRKKIKTQAKNNEPKCFFVFFFLSDFEHFSFRNDRRTDVDVHVCIQVAAWNWNWNLWHRFRFRLRFRPRDSQCGGIGTLTSTMTRVKRSPKARNNGGHAHKMPKCHRAMAVRVNTYIRIYSDLRCYRREPLRGGVDFDKCLINFVPRSNIKPGYFLT